MILSMGLHSPKVGIRLGNFVKGGHAMPDATYSPLKAEVAGSVVLKVLRILPDSASAEMFGN